MLCSTTLLAAGSNSRGEVERREPAGIIPRMTEHWGLWRPCQALCNGLELGRTVEVALFVSQLEGLKELIQSQRAIGRRESFE